MAAGKTRVLDPITRDYVLDEDRGAVQVVRDARTAIYHQIQTKLGQWWGDPDAGSRMFELERAKSLLRTPIVIQDIFSEALQPLVDDGRITDPEFETERRIDRITTSVTTTDVQTGEELELTDLLPFQI
jgi:phage gp46-like protein